MDFFLFQGFLVFAGCLNTDGEGALSLKELHSQRLIVLSMDVTKQDQLDKAVLEVKRMLSKDGELMPMHLSCPKDKIIQK